jgi:hypothetical protein
MTRHIALLLALCLPAYGHQLVVDVEMERPAIFLRASYGPGQPAAHVAVAALAAATPGSPGISGETDASGAFTFTPPAEGEWLVQVDDGYGHIAKRTIVVDWAGSAMQRREQPNLWARTGAGLFVIFGLTAFFVWGRRLFPNQQP